MIRSGSGPGGIGALLLVAAVGLAGAGCGPSDGPIRATLRAQVGQARRAGDPQQALVARFYREREFRPGWTNGIGARREAFQLEVALDRATRSGFVRDPGEARRLHNLLVSLRPNIFGPTPEPRRLAELDLLLSRNYFACASQFLAGHLRPRDLPIDWRTPARRADLVRTLEAALHERRVGDSLERLEPGDPGYAALRAALSRDRELALRGGWRMVRPGVPLALGRESSRVPALRARLAAEDDLGPAPADSLAFDERLRAAVLRFQRRYGLDTTGVVGARDIEALDVPAQARTRQIELNLERWHWLPDTLGERHLIVNIPEFALRIVERGRPVAMIRAIVGKPDNPTPVFSAEVRYVVFNPLWNVPARIAAREVLAQVQDDPDYLARNNIRVFDGTTPRALEIDPETIRWSMLSPDEMPYAFRQDPGPQNPVGHVKFMCPNPFDVYLHDTPTTHLFRRGERAFSHGCVRLEKPLVLAEYLLGGRPGWDLKGIGAAIDTSHNQAVTVPEPVPVHFFYFTAWVDERGQVQFRRDLYGIDDLLDRALRGESLPSREQLDQARDQNALVREVSNPSER